MTDKTLVERLRESDGEDLINAADDAADLIEQLTAKTEDRGGTHSEQCYTFGHRHYECALRRIDELQARLDRMEIRHPTDVCDCRYDYTGGVQTVRKRCPYHAGLETQIVELTASRDRHERDVDVFRQRWIEEQAKRLSYEKWFADNAAVLATHRIGGYSFAAGMEEKR